MKASSTCDYLSKGRDGDFLGAALPCGTCGRHLGDMVNSDEVDVDILALSAEGSFRFSLGEGLALLNSIVPLQWSPTE